MTTKITKALGVIIWLGAAALCAAVLSLAGVFLYLDPHTPEAETYRHVKLQTPLRVYSADGALLAEYGERRLIPITLDQVPQQFIDALLDTEDKRFYEHSGIDFISLTNDSLGLIQGLLFEGEIGSGASTITMQLARNVSFSLEVTFIRKFKEMLLALKIEQALTKDEILELYINLVSFGKRVYGAEAAARTYYGKSLGDLDLAQLAMLAGIPQAPSAGNPINGPERAIRRRNVVLSRMLEQGSITRDEHDDAASQPVTARVFQRELDVAAPYAAELVRQQLIYSYPDLYTGGYEVFTTVDAKLQDVATQSLRKGLEDYDQRHGYRGPAGRIEPPTELLDDIDRTAWRDQAREAARRIPPSGELEAATVIDLQDGVASLVTADNSDLQLTFEQVAWARPYIDVDRRGAPPKDIESVLSVGDVVHVRIEEDVWQLTQAPDIQGAVVSLEPDTGKILALVGGYEFTRNQYNHATQAKRQPGSGFKPVVYAAALANGVTPASIFMDAPLVFDDENLETEYRPDNDNNRYNGPTRLREALYRSINLVSMRVLLAVGAGNVSEYAKGLGYNTDTFPRNTQLAIGGGTMAVTPMDMARTYAIVANGGFGIRPHIIERLVDVEGEVLIEANHPIACRECELDAEVLDLGFSAIADETEEDLEATDANDPEQPPEDETGSETEVLDPGPALAPRVMDARVAFLLDSMLKDVIKRGTGRKARVLERNDIAGKTGTTNDAADTWFNGYNPDVATTVWVGFSNFGPLGRREYGATTPLPIWIDYMREALADKSERFHPQPDGIVTMKIDPETGEAARPGQANAIFEYFLSEHTPEPAASTNQGAIEDEIKAVDLF